MQEVSEATLEAVDREIGGLLRRAEEEAVAIIVEHRAVLDAVVDALVDAETLSGAPLEALLGGVHALPTPAR